MSIFTGKTVLITGGSRGIGQSIGLRFAAAGANIVILAKEETQNTSASIYVTADQINAAGGKALPLNVDVTDDNAMEMAIDEAVTQFGGLDVLINNVSTFCFTDTINTQPEKFDSLMAVNVRATFLTSKLCQPHLKKSTNPHIINISPPLDMNPRWFKNHLAFTMSKYGMSMCTLGMAEEFKKDGIAVNSLWPQTTIATTTIQDHFVSEVYTGSRWPTIMADAAYELAQKNAKKYTGYFLIDEELLREAGVSDFAHYAVDSNVSLIQDLFIPDKRSNESQLNTPLGEGLFIQNQ